MNILFVTNMYPGKDQIHTGIFIKEQIGSYTNQHKIQYKVYLVDGIKSKLNYIKSIFIIHQLIRKNKYDLIHIHFGLSGLFLLFNPFIKIPTLLTLHGSDIQSYKKKDGLMQYISRMVVRRCDKVIILNDNMANLLKRHQHKLIKIPCGIDLKLFNSCRNNRNGKNFLIGFPSARSRPVKNYSLFIKIIKILKDEGYPVKIIEFDSFNRQEVVENLSNLDCLLMTSLSEGSPQIIKEALACNVPIISTNVGDVGLLLKGVTNCEVVDSFEAKLFVDKIKQLLQLDSEERVSNGNGRIKQLGLDQESVVNKLHLLYTEMTMTYKADPGNFERINTTLNLD